MALQGHAHRIPDGWAIEDVLRESLGEGAIIEPAPTPRPASDYGGPAEDVPPLARDVNGLPVLDGTSRRLDG